MVLLHCAIKEKDSLNYRSVCSLLTAVPVAFIFSVLTCATCAQNPAELDFNP